MYINVSKCTTWIRPFQTGMDACDFWILNLKFKPFDTLYQMAF